MKVANSLQAAQVNSVQNKPSVKQASAQPESQQNYDKVTLSDSAKALMAASQKTS